ncbi:uncharacterized protein LOC127847021 [Dreissena polymorpha]|uniref:uncharacterized protein LOC127847021 n=1 Tax=Dreissena polymorpha TaxID=45954 RepID=UPI0022656F2A|nr:uncharacterized protein LOC127847021 [Dreissena polymorpha]
MAKAVFVIIVYLACVIHWCSGHTLEACVIYVNTEGDSEQVVMDIVNTTANLSAGAAFIPLTREPCAKASRIHLTILPADIVGITETPSRLSIVYDISMIRNGTWLRSYIRSLDISAFRNFRQINCWLGIPVSDHMLIHVAIKVTGQDERELKFLDADLRIPSSEANTCRGLCQDSDIDFKTIYTCLSNATLIHLAHVRILRVTFTPSNGNASSLVIYTHGERNTTMYFPNIYDGAGIMEITYKYSEFYCSVHKEVRLFCDPALTTESQSQVKDPKVDSFGTFVIFGLVTMLVFTVIIILIIFIVQKLNFMRRLCCNGKDKATRDHHQHRSTVLSTNTENVIKLTALRKIDEINELQPLASSENHSKGTRVRRQSTSPSNTSVPQGLRYDKPVCGRKLQRSVTQALLQNMSSNSTSILLLPLPFDQFTRDIVELLGTVLSMEANIPTRYSFDRDVQAEYFRDAKLYIEKLCSDINKLLIFVCVTNLANLPTNKSEDPTSLINDLLRAMDVKRLPPKCKIVFLHLTDDDKTLQNKYHGLDIHIKQENSFERFLAEVLKECGKSSEENNLLNKMVTCDASKQFVEYLKEDHT